MTIAVPQRQSVAEMVSWCEMLASSTLLPDQYQRHPANLMFAAEYADALGISRIHALTSINVIKGKPSASADLMAAMIRRAGHKLRVSGDSHRAVAQLIRSDDPDYVFEAVFDVQDARRAGLWVDDQDVEASPRLRESGWYKYPAAMLKARAISAVARMGAQDTLCGCIYTPEELGAEVSEDGQVVRTDAVVTARSPERAPEPGRETPRARSKDDLILALDDANLGIPELRELWREAHNAGYEDLCETIVALVKDKQNPEPAATEDPSQRAQGGESEEQPALGELVEAEPA